MIKRHFAIIFLFASIVFSQSIDQDVAKIVANNFLKHLNLSKTKNLNIVSGYYSVNNGLSLVKENELCVGYIYELKPKGFIITSNNKSTEPIIAYSFDSDYNSVLDTGNVLHKLVKYDLKKRLSQVSNLDNKQKKEIAEKWQQLATSSKIETTSFQQWPTAGTTQTGGWIDFSWDQNNPYNNFCPLDNTTQSKSLTGCTATAWSQLINYYRPSNLPLLDSRDKYISSSRLIKIDEDSLNNGFPSFNRINNYIKNINNAFAGNDNVEGDFVSALNFYVGILSGMDYSSAGSGSPIFNLIWNPKNNFFLSSRSFLGFGQGDWSDFYPILKSNMMNGLPSIFTITSNKVCTNAHAVICDGYNTNEFFHINFGWGDNLPDKICEAWYCLPQDMPISYNIISEAIVNLSSVKHNLYPFLITKSNFQFGGIKLNSYTKELKFSISNPFSQSIIIKSIELTADFEISTDNLTYLSTLNMLELYPNNELSFYLRGKTDKIGLQTGKAIIRTIDTFGKEYLYQLDLSLIGMETNGTIITPGEVSGVWKKDGSPYLITGDIFVPNWKALRIEPGVDVVFQGKYGFLVYRTARLIALGNEQDSVRFYPQVDSIGWLGLEIWNSSSNYKDVDSLVYCSISGGVSFDAAPQNVGGGITIYDGSVIIKNCHIYKNSAYSGGAINIWTRYGYFPVHISNTLIERNHSSAHGPIKIKAGPNTSGAIIPTVIFENDNIVNNSTTDNCSVATISYGANVHFINCLFWNNTSFSKNLFLMGYDNHGITTPDTLNLSYCAFDTTSYKLYSFGEVKPVIKMGQGNINGDPMLNNYISGELALNSTCIDAGDPSPKYYDKESDQPGIPVSPAKGTLRNDIGIGGGGVYNLPFSPPSLILPYNNTVFVSNTNGSIISFFWQDNKLFNKYHLQFAADSVFNNILIEYSSLNTNKKEVILPFISSTYYWRVKGNTKIQTQSDWSETRCFKVNIVSVGLENNQIPKTYSLSQNYPNPFNPSTKIKYSIPKTSLVTLKVYDLLGKEIGTLVKEEKSPGYYETTFNGSNLSSGVYFYRISAGEYIQTKKFILLK